MAYEQLKLENQLCFPVYAASRLITREYQPYLDKLGITYPQYLVLMILWEDDGQAVNDIAKRMILNTNTVTPLLKRLEYEGIVKRTRSKEDERKVLVHLTGKGRKMESQASEIPEALARQLMKDEMEVEDLIRLKTSLQAVIQVLSD